MDGAREKRFSANRVLDEVEQIRGEAPELRGAGVDDLFSELTPGGAPVLAVRCRVACFGSFRDGLLHDIVEMQAVTFAVDEWEDLKVVVKCFGVRSRDQRLQQGDRCAANRGDSVQGLSDKGIGNVFQIEVRELLNGPLERSLLQLKVGPFQGGGRSQCESQRMTSGKAVHSQGVIPRNARLGKKRDRIILFEGPQSDRVEEPLPARGCEPGGDGRLAPRQDHAHVVRKCGNEDLPQPGVQQAQALVGVEGENHPL